MSVYGGRKCEHRVFSTQKGKNLLLLLLVRMRVALRVTESDELLRMSDNKNNGEEK